MTIHREGHSILTGTTVVLVAINVLLFYFIATPFVLKVCVVLLSLIVFILVLQFFRYPSRSITVDDKYIIAPADGKVVVIEKTQEDEFFKDERMMVSIFMSPLNVHANWYPISGIIKFIKYHKGKYLVAWHPKASTENERSTIVIEKDARRVVMCRQVAGAVARRIVYYPRATDIVRQGGEMGFIKFGSRVDIYMPPDVKILVQLNQKSIGGVTVIGEFR
jgi:phosphatidylserine decarboxylase